LSLDFFFLNRYAEINDFFVNILIHCTETFSSIEVYSLVMPKKIKCSTLHAATIVASCLKHCCSRL